MNQTIKVRLRGFCFSCSILIISSCASYHYKFKIIEPQSGKTTSVPPYTGQSNPGSTEMSYEDSLVSMKFFFVGIESYDQVDTHDHYDGTHFTLQNMTDSTIIIDWNKISYIDVNGNVGNTVMHQDIKYSDCASTKTPTNIPSKGKISDVIVPCYGVSMSSIGWHEKSLPCPSVIDNVIFGIYFPILIGSTEKIYTFKFSGTSYVIK